MVDGGPQNCNTPVIPSRRLRLCVPRGCNILHSVSPILRLSARRSGRLALVPHPFLVLLAHRNARDKRLVNLRKDFSSRSLLRLNVLSLFIRCSLFGFPFLFLRRVPFDSYGKKRKKKRIIRKWDAARGAASGSSLASMILINGKCAPSPFAFPVTLGNQRCVHPCDRLGLRGKKKKRQEMAKRARDKVQQDWRRRPAECAKDAGGFGGLSSTEKKGKSKGSPTLSNRRLLRSIGIDIISTWALLRFALSLGLARAYFFLLDVSPLRRSPSLQVDFQLFSTSISVLHSNYCRALPSNYVFHRFLYLDTPDLVTSAVLGALFLADFQPVEHKEPQVPAVAIDKPHSSGQASPPPDYSTYKLKQIGVWCPLRPFNYLMAI